MFLPDPSPDGAFIPCRPAAVTASLGHVERDVVIRARRDAGLFGWEGTPASPAANRLRRLIGRLAGVEPVRPLADPGLERLRLFACMMRRGDARAGETAEALRRDGYGEVALREAVTLALD